MAHSAARSEASARLLSVNLAARRSLRSRGADVETGIFKEPARGRVALTRLTLVGDVQVDKRYHGGPEQAVYLYPFEHYAHFRVRRPEISAGFFGENFTTQGLLETNVRVGDVFRVGSAVIQITKPRAPCFKMGLKAGSPAFVKELLESRRLGFYARVLEEGDVGEGDAIVKVSSDPLAPTVAADIEARYFGS